MKYVKLTFLSILPLLFFSLTCCSSDDDSASNETNFGDFNLNVSGDFNATKSGFADFDKLDINTFETWELNMIDTNPQSLSLTLSLNSATSEINQPTPGTYEIGFEPNSNSIFSVVYTHIPDGNFSESVEYTTLPVDDNGSFGGTLTIETSNSEVVSGNFEFTVAKLDDNFNVDGTINVSGTFSARARQN